MPKAFLNLLLKGGNDAKKTSRQLSVKPVEEALPSKGSALAMRNPKINTTIYTRDLDFPTLDLVGIHIQAMSEEELQKIAVVSVKQDEKEEKRGNFVGTIADKRMYPHGNSFCSSCFLPKIFCPGHLGYRKLVRPIINIWFYKYVVSVLESICHECGTLLMNLETAKRYGKSVDRLKKIADASKSMTCRNRDCPNYENPNPAFIKKTDNMLKIQLKFSNNKMGNISSTKILNLFNRLTLEELEALGFPQNTRYSIHPKNMLFTSLPILPENHRPAGMVDGEPKPNSLTSIYHKIIQIDSSLASGVKDDRMSLEALENEVCSIHFRDSETSKSGNSNAIDTSKNINEILSKKKGLVRSNAQATRCNHTGRTVISPGGPKLRFGQIVLPSAMSKILVDERICDKNIDYFSDLVQRGLISSIITRDQKISALKRHSDFVLRKGMIVRRPLENGDPVIFNRNPTLHKHSMMGYIAKLQPGMTIGLHGACTKPHGADFDGDEGNIHVCPSYEARAEILHLSGCWNIVVGSQFSTPMMGLINHPALGAYILSQFGVFEDRIWDKLTSEVFAESKRLETLEKRVRKNRPQDLNWKTGPALFSALLPENLYYNNKGVFIKNGVLIKGKLTQGIVGVSTGSLVHKIYGDYGSHIVSQFISEGHILLDRFLEYFGFTVGYKDCDMPVTEKKVKEVVDAEMRKTEETLKNLASLADDKNYEIREFYNASVQAALDSTKVIGQQIVKDALSENNALKIMADSGSKGKETDIAQIVGLLGQQFVRDGKRPALMLNKESSFDWKGEGLRFLPFYDIHHAGRGDKILNRGFADRPLGKGLRPGQFVAMMMVARISIIDKAFGTASTGYSHHTIAKALEDLRYAYNGTICGDQGNIVQYAGGGDSYEPMEMLEVKTPGFGSIWSPIDIPSIMDMLNNED